MLMGTSTDEPTSTQILQRYLDAGGTFLDTADCYAWWPDAPAGAAPFTGGESETLLGRWFARSGRRDDVFLATKGSAWVADPAAARAGRVSPPAQYAGAGGDTLRHALDRSLRRLGVEHVDLYYVHVDDLATPLEETLQALAGLVAAGKTRHIGWSNVSTARLERIAALCAEHGWPAPVAVQQEHSYLRPATPTVSVVDDAQLAYLRAHPELTLVAYSPILKGVYDDPAKRQTHHVMQPYAGPDADARFATVSRLAKQLGVTGNQLVLAWLLHQRDPARVTLVGPRTLAHYDAAVAALDLTLDAETLAALAAAGG
jgi:aryl-alcohol dehydrogenase-like predicted oxidoreductase